MIKIIDNRNSIEVSFDGDIQRMPSKVGLTETTTMLGSVKSEHIRGVINLDITVNNMSEQDYFALEDVFMLANNSLDIQDEERGVYYSDYYIKGESFSLTENTDLFNGEYFYLGTLQLYKR